MAELASGAQWAGDRAQPRRKGKGRGEGSWHQRLSLIGRRPSPWPRPPALPSECRACSRGPGRGDRSPSVWRGGASGGGAGGRWQGIVALGAEH